MRTTILTFLILCSVFLQAQNNEASKRKKEFNLSTGGLALNGYDAISYLTGKPKQGNKNFSYTDNGVSYYFSSQANLDLFKKSPEKFEPAYGGWCAYAMGSNGQKVEVDPETYKLVDNKLYLFYNTYFNNTLPKWNKDEVKLKPAADKNWSSFYK